MYGSLTLSMGMSMTKINLTRRGMMGVSGAIAAPMLIPSSVLSQTAPSKKITLGCIGMGGQGTNLNLKMFLTHEDCRIETVCDVFMNKALNAQKLVNEAYGNNECKAVQDFRDVLADPTIDAVVISTPDHWHVPMSLMAMQAGKDVFCEKPTQSIHEGRILADAFAKSDRIFQAGIEDRSQVHFHKMVELVRNGAIGELERVDVMMPGGIWYAKEEPCAPPADLDWNLWQGPAPYHNFSPNRAQAGRWRQIDMYSKGAITDFGTHLVDTAQLAVNDPDVCPVDVSGTGKTPPNAMTNVPIEYDLNYTYGNGVEMRVYNGPAHGWDSKSCRLEFHGSKGWIKRMDFYGGITASEKEILRTKYDPSVSNHFARPPREQREFLDSIKSRKNTTYTPGDLHMMSTTLHMGVICIDLGRGLKWDVKKEQFINDSEANAKCNRPKARDWEAEA